MSSYKKMTDEKLIQQHRHMERIANILHQGIKIGAAEKFWEELHETTLQNIFEVREEYSRRHPESKEKAIRELLQFADLLIDQNNKDLFGDNSKYEQHIMIEYHKPNPGMKTVSIDFRKDPDSPMEHIEAEMMMYDDLDFLKADLETALDKIAETLPEPPAAENNETPKQGE